MKRIILIPIILLAPHGAFAQAANCTPLIQGTSFINPSDGKLYQCTAQGWLERPAPPIPNKAGDWRFNPQNSLMEYFDGTKWTAVQPKS